MHLHNDQVGIELAISISRQDLETCIVAMTDRGQAYDYPPAVAFQIKDGNIEDYMRAADFLQQALHDGVDPEAAVVYSLDLPYAPGGLPWNDGFDVSLVNYTPLAILLPLIFGVWYLVSAKNTYQGPVSTLEEDEVTRD